LTDAYREAFVYDINTGENAVLESVASMQHPRIYSNAVVLPTGDVVVAGGQTKGRKFTDTGAVLQPELWSPETKRFTPLAPMAVPRTYHSTCILMKDARMVCMGGGL
jgi:galactose oxidase